MIRAVLYAGSGAGVPRCYGFQLVATSASLYPVVLRDRSGREQNDIVVADGSWYHFDGEEAGPFIIDPDGLLFAPGGNANQLAWTILYGTEPDDRAAGSSSVAPLPFSPFRQEQFQFTVAFAGQSCNLVPQAQETAMEVWTDLPKSGGTVIAGTVWTIGSTEPWTTAISMAAAFNTGQRLIAPFASLQRQYPTAIANPAYSQSGGNAQPQVRGPMPRGGISIVLSGVCEAAATRGPLVIAYYFR